jgi:hypothetical protein
VVLGNAPLNAKYTSPHIQKQILDLLACNVHRDISNEIGSAKFCLIVDESRNASRKEQMAMTMMALIESALKEELRTVLADHSLDVENNCGQGYDGASNMCRGWNGMQSNFIEGCPCAYYVHYFAHQLQVADVHNFFKDVATVVNTVLSSTKRNDDLHDHQVAEMEHLIELNELETGSGANQIGTLQRPGDTRWSSHYDSVCSLINLYKPTYLELKDIATTRGAVEEQRQLVLLNS